MVRIRNNIFLCLIICLCLCSCSKEEKVVGAFGTGETDVFESKIENTSISEEDKFAIKDEVVLSTEDNIVENSETDISLNNLQEAKISEIEQKLKSSNSEITEEDVNELLNTDDFIDLSDSEKEEIVSVIIEKVNNSSISETLDSNLVYKHATSYVTDEIIIDEEAPSRSYSEEELESMHLEAEKLYQKQEQSSLAEIHTK